MENTVAHPDFIREVIPPDMLLSIVCSELGMKGWWTLQIMKRLDEVVDDEVPQDAKRYLAQTYYGSIREVFGLDK